jgi:uncharacterized protein DUF4339
MATRSIYISKGGQPPGAPCSFDEARQMLSSGDLSPEDLAWCEGLPEWQPVPTVVEWLSLHQPSTHVSLFRSLIAELSIEETAAPHRGTGAKLDRSREKSWLGRIGIGVTKQKRLTPAELGEELWVSCKQWSREFFTSLNGRAGEMGFLLNDESEFVLLEESLLVHLWMISRTLSGELLALEVLQQRFFTAHAHVAGAFESEQERNTYINSVQTSMQKRFGLYEHLWDQRCPHIQTVLVSFMLKQMFKGDGPHPAPRDPRLLGLAHAYVIDRLRSLQEWREQFTVE